MKEKVEEVHEATLQALFEQAKRSVRQHRPPAEREVLEQRVRQLWADYTRHEGRKEEIAERMGALFRQLNRKGEAPDRVGSLNAAMMARLLAESGPLSDFNHWREVLHYCGLNLCERESGTYKGEMKISKKERGRFRKVLGQAAFALVQGDGPLCSLLQARTGQKNELLEGHRGNDTQALQGALWTY